MMIHPSLTPPVAPLAMPTQDLSTAPEARPVRPQRHTWLARLVIFGGSLLLTALACWQLFLVMPMNGSAMSLFRLPTGLVVVQWVMLTLFAATFGWIALSAMAALAGLLPGPSRLLARPDAPLQGKAVLLMPIYNEDVHSACAALAAMAESLGELNHQAHFEVFVLSDSDDAGIRAREVEAVRHLQQRLAGILPVWYRQRERNTERKAGNIRDFIQQWGGRYDYMAVLDADSLLDATTLAQLVREMDADPATGLLQTLPNVQGGSTLFARLQQFAGMAYGPVFVRGLCAWQGDGGNYWGHNALVRIGAFAESAGLPNLPGPRPFGGEIRSHDFVEAALIRRAGWSVRMLPELTGTWESCPPTLQDAAVRDRRWAQGNVQHLAVLFARGLHWQNRVHMLMGVMNYLSSLLWLLLVTLGLGVSAYLTVIYANDTTLQALAVFDTDRMVGLFVVTLTLLLLPKGMGFVSGLTNRTRRGGVSRWQFCASASLELVFSVLHAPIFMLMHSHHLWQIARGQDSGWTVQQRQVSTTSWRALVARHWVRTLIGCLVLTVLFWLPLKLAVWLVPIVAGLLLAIPLSALSGSRTAGLGLARYGVLTIGEEQVPPTVVKRQQALRHSPSLA
ncbi:MAG: glucans biosynthesis glucosyltransferase MdoH [Saccharospirillum sp.]